MSFDLTAKQRRAILGGEWPHIPLSVEEAEQVEVGKVIVLKPRLVWITLLGPAKDRRKALYLRYSVRDDRPRLLRRSPPRAALTTDADSTPETIEDSFYTPTLAQAVDDAGEAVPAEYQNLLTVQAKSERASREQADHAEDIARRQARAVTESVRQILIMGARHGVDVSPRIAAIQREVELANRDLQDAVVS